MKVFNSESGYFEDKIMLLLPVRNWNNLLMILNKEEIEEMLKLNDNHEFYEACARLRDRLLELEDLGDESGIM